jgi:hypothetical protein
MTARRSDQTTLDGLLARGHMGPAARERVLGHVLEATLRRDARPKTSRGSR